MIRKILLYQMKKKKRQRYELIAAEKGKNST